MRGAALKIKDFSLRDYRGKLHALSDYANSKRVVVVFVGCECPVAKLVAARLAKIARQFEPQGVAFLAIDANNQDSLSDLAQFARALDLGFPILKDVGNAVADQFGAERTPEVFLLDQERCVQYRGRIDDQYLVGKRRPHPTREDLKAALEESLSGRPVTTPETEAVGCHIGRVPERKENAAAEPRVTYSQQIARLLQTRCVNCHREGEIAPFPLTSYEEVVGWGETIREVVEQQRMPPWPANPAFGHFANDCRLADDEKQLIYDWLDAGSPEGDRNQLPEPRVFTVGWQIPQPDQVIFIAEEPVDVPAEGVVKYQHYLVDPGFKEDRWIQAAECRPGNRAVVHHIVVNFIPPGAKPRIGLNGATVGFAPGIPPVRMPQGMAMFVPAGSKLLFQMHYTPNGSAQQDRSSLGLVFADPEQVRDKVESFGAANVILELPPGAEDVKLQSQHRFSRQVRLLSMMPHMHLRGKSFRFEVDYPDGSHEILLDVPRYDFNWQLRVRAGRSQSAAGRHAADLHRPLRQFSHEPGQSRSDGHGSLGRTNLGRDDDRLFRRGLVHRRPQFGRRDAGARRCRCLRRAKELLLGGIEALGGQQRLAEHPVLSYKMQGKVYIAQAPLAYEGTATIQPAANHLRMQIDGTGFKFALVLDGDHGWFKFGDRVQELPAEAVEEQQERLHAETVALLYPVLGEDSFKLALLVDVKVGGQPAQGVLVRQEAHRDVRLYFDPETHRLLKMETPINENGKDVSQETLFEDYVQAEGVWRARRLRIRWDGADRALREMSDIRSTDQADEGAFGKP